MSWLEELDALLNKSSAEELEKLWAKYDEFDCGPEVEDFINSSMEFFYYQKLEGVMDNICQPGIEEYTNSNDRYALAA